MPNFFVAMAATEAVLEVLRTVEEEGLDFHVAVLEMIVQLLRVVDLLAHEILQNNV